MITAEKEYPPITASAGGDFSQREKKYFKSPVDNRENAVYLNSHICRMNIKIVFSIP